MLADENAPDILGLCETFLDSNISDGQVTMNSFEKIDAIQSKKLVVVLCYITEIL